MKSILDQDAPQPNKRDAIWELVIRDMQERDAVGRARYGTPLQAFNGRDSLVDLYQELLDAVAYTRQHIEEKRENAQVVRRALEAVRAGNAEAAEAYLVYLLER